MTVPAEKQLMRRFKVGNNSAARVVVNWKAAFIVDAGHVRVLYSAVVQYIAESCKPNPACQTPHNIPRESLECPALEYPHRIPGVPKATVAPKSHWSALPQRIQRIPGVLNLRAFPETFSGASNPKVSPQNPWSAQP